MEEILLTDHKPYPEIEPIPDPPTVVSAAAAAIGVVGTAHLGLAAFGAEAQQTSSLLALAAFGAEGQQTFNLVVGLVEIGIAIALAIGLSTWRKERDAWLERQKADRAHLLEQASTGHHHS